MTINREFIRLQKELKHHELERALAAHASSRLTEMQDAVLNLLVDCNTDSHTLLKVRELFRQTIKVHLDAFWSHSSKCSLLEWSFVNCDPNEPNPE